MDDELIDHGKAKFPCAGLIATSKGRDWSGIHAERRRHPAGNLPAYIGAVTEITYAVRGDASGVVHRCGAGRRQSTPARDGTLWISPQGVVESATRITHDLPDILHICLPNGLFTRLSDEVFPRLTVRALRYEAGVDDPLMAYMARTVSSELMQETSSGNLLVETTTLALCARLATHYASDVTYRGGEPSSQQMLDRKRLRRVLEFINDKLEESISVEDLARVACLSQFHFSRAFKKATGKAPHSFLSERRLEYAKSLLLHSGRSLTDIAFACNFSTQASFTKAFSRTVGISPGRYRGGTSL